MDEKPLSDDCLLRQVLQRRANGLKSYRLVVTSRPCIAVHEYLKGEYVDRTLHLAGFTPEKRDVFMQQYSLHRYKKDWKEVGGEAKLNTLIESSKLFFEPLSCLPLIATLLVEVLPTMSPRVLPRCRTDLFTMLVLNLLARDFPELKGQDEWEKITDLPNDILQPLLVLSKLAMDGLLAKTPQLVFLRKDIVSEAQKLGLAWEKIEPVVHATMLSFVERGRSGDVSYYQFLHLSFHEWFATLSTAYSYPNDSKLSHGTATGSSAPTAVSLQKHAKEFGQKFHSRSGFSNFWVFASGILAHEDSAEPLFDALSSCDIVTDADKEFFLFLMIDMLEEADVFAGAGNQVRVSDDANSKRLLQLGAKILDASVWFSSGILEKLSLRELFVLQRAFLLPDLRRVRAPFPCEAEVVYSASLVEFLRRQSSVEWLYLDLHPGHCDDCQVTSDVVDGLKTVFSTPILRYFGVDLHQVDLTVRLLDQLSSVLALNSSIAEFDLQAHFGFVEVQEATAEEVDLHASVLRLCQTVLDHHSIVSFHLHLPELGLDHLGTVTSAAENLLEKSSHLERLDIAVAADRSDVVNRLATSLEKNSTLTSFRVCTYSDPRDSEEADAAVCSALRRLGRTVRAHTSLTRFELVQMSWPSAMSFLPFVEEVVNGDGTTTRLEQLEVVGENDHEKIVETLRSRGGHLEVACRRHFVLEHVATGHPFVGTLPRWEPAQ